MAKTKEKARPQAKARPQSKAVATKSAHDYLFQREGMPPVGDMIPCSLQHVLASFFGIITPALLIAGTFGFSDQERTDIVQVALILSALDTGLQAFAPFRRIGGNLPIVMGVSFAFLPALNAMGETFSFGALLAGEIVGGIAAILFGLFYGRLKAFFPPVVTGTVIFTIGVSLYPTAIKYMAGGEGTPLWGTPQAWFVALVTFAVVFGLNNFAKGTLKLGSVFFGMIAGIIVSAPFGMLDFSAVGEAGIFALPKFMPYALEFHPEVCITLAVVYPMVAIQVIGDVSAACLAWTACPPSASSPAPSSPRAAPRSSPPSSAACPPLRWARTWASSAPTRSSTSGSS